MQPDQPCAPGHPGPSRPGLHFAAEPPVVGGIWARVEKME